MISGCSRISPVFLVDEAEIGTNHRLKTQSCLSAVLHRLGGPLDIVVHILDPQLGGVDGEHSPKDLSES